MVRSRDTGSGRPAIPVHVHKLRGTYRPDRHGNRGPKMGGEPLRIPDDLPEHAEWLWREVTRLRGPWLCGSDAASLRTLSMAFHFMKRCEAKLLEDATDKDARCSWGAYAATFLSLGAKFGLSPSDRAKLGEDKPQRDAEDELEAMLS